MLFMPMYLYQQASTLQNWPFAAAISIIFLVAVLAAVSLFNVLGRLSQAATPMREAMAMSASARRSRGARASRP